MSISCIHFSGLTPFSLQHPSKVKKIAAMHQSLAIENLYLPVQGLVVGIFTHGHVGQYAGIRFCMCIVWGEERLSEYGHPVFCIWGG